MPSAAALRDKRAFWADHGLAVTSMQALLFGMNALNIFGASYVVEQTLDYLERMAHVGAALGAKRLVFGSPRNRDRQGIDDAQALARAVDFFSTLSARVSGLNVMFVLEPNPTQYACNFATTARQAREVVRQVNRPEFGLHLDAGIMSLNAEDPADTVALCKDDLRHVHISEPWLAPVETASEHHKGLAAALHDVAYDGCLSIEMRSQNDAAKDCAAVGRALAQVGEVYRTHEP